MAKRRRYAGIGGRVALERGDTLGGTIPLIMKDQVFQGKSSRKRTLRRRNEGGVLRAFGRAVVLLALLVAIVATLYLVWGVVGEDLQGMIPS